MGILVQYNVLTSIRYRDVYCGCGGSQQYTIMGGAVLKLPFIAPKSRLPRVQKKAKKMLKNGNVRFAKNTFLF